MVGQEIGLGERSVSLCLYCMVSQVVGLGDCFVFRAPQVFRARVLRLEADLASPRRLAEERRAEATKLQPSTPPPPSPPSDWRRPPV